MPGALREREEVIEFAGAAEPEGAVDDDAFAVDVLRHVAEKKSGEVGEFFVAAEALHGMRFARVVFELFRGHEA